MLRSVIMCMGLVTTGVSTSRIKRIRKAEIRFHKNMIMNPNSIQMNLGNSPKNLFL
jgi:hypothetical protein